MRLRLKGRFWDLIFRSGFRRTEGVIGICEAPGVRFKKIIIDADVTGEELLEVLIHEQLHACFWNIDEEDVSESARDIARNLTRLGFHDGD